MPIVDRRSMDEHSRELTGEGLPEEQNVAAFSSEDRDGADLDTTLNVPGNLSGVTIGHYLVGERLGGGAMASVYRAQDQHLDRMVAMKVLLPGADSVMQARFRREARMVSTLVHPHIVRTLQVGRGGGIIYIAMELVEGVSLAELLEQHGKLFVADAARILAPVADALAYAHERGIIHRDVKPSNILLQRAAPGAEHSVTVSVLPYPVIPLLSDFGIARALDAPELTNAGRTIGTPAFMAPEQCAGRADIDGRADVYALGAVLYRCLVGRAPFGGSTTQILHAHVYEPLLIPDVVADSLPVAAVRLMARAMMKEPSQRFEQIGQMAAELRRVAELTESSLPAQPDGAADPTMTMASLPVAKAPSTSRVLVPAATAAAPRGSPLKPGTRVGVPGTTPARAIPVAPPPAAHTRSRRNRWGVMAAIAALIVTSLFLGAIWANSLIQGGPEENVASGDPTATPAVVAGAETPNALGVALNGTPGAAATRNAADGVNRPAGQNNRPTAEATAGPTRAPQPPIQSLEPTWSNALASFDEGDWEQALVDLILVKRFIEHPDSEYDEEIDAQRLDEMLVISYVGAATDLAQAGRWQRAIDYLRKASEISPGNSLLPAIADNLEALAELEGDNEPTAEEERRALWVDIARLLATFADRFERAGNFCDAATQVDNAIQLAVSRELQERQVELTRLCTQSVATADILQTGGTILYSAGGNGSSYNIWRLPITADNLSLMRSELVLQNAAMPQVSPNGQMLAFYNRQGGSEGLYTIGINENLATFGAPMKIGSRPEDGRDSPASWNASSTQLAYSIQLERQPPQIYVTALGEGASTRHLRTGKDPAWYTQFGNDRLVFNGTAIDGQNPGLWAMTSSGDGMDRYQVTPNGNDQRPVWSPDGRYIVFMSNRDGGNWEVYRLTIDGGDLVRLSDGHSAQDGLPTISPDGRWVAFVSDREGTWQLYYVSIDGGPVHHLSTLAAQPIAWLEHSIQWVE